MSSLAFKLIIPSALGLCFAAACTPDLDALSASYSAIGGLGGSAGEEQIPDGGSGNETSSGGRSSGGRSGSGSGSGGGAVAAVCANMKKDSNESDVDCGGTSKCERCATNANCTANRDCDSALFCKNNHCAEPTCTDKVQNQDETAVDCGGSCKACDLGVACTVHMDCTGEYCLDGVCADHCLSGARESDETDKDCGGSCKPCDDKLKCSEGADCTSKICSNNACVPPTCSDAVKNQT